MDGDEDFFDDDWDDTLQILEQKILPSTQQQTGTVPSHPNRQSGVKDAGRTETHHASRIGEKAWPRLPGQLPSRVSSAPPASAPDQPSSDYGIDDGDVIDLAAANALPQPAHPPRTKEASIAPNDEVQRPQWLRRPPMDAETKAAFAAADAEMAGHDARSARNAANVHGNAADRTTQLQNRVAELEAERDALQRAQTDSRGTVIQKQGEIAVLRSKHASEMREYDRKITAMQKQHSEEVARHKAEIEASKKEREKIETNNRFLQHDLAQETEKAKRTNGAIRPRPIAASGSTPKKSRRVNIGDGFDDNEVLQQSPSKSKDNDIDRNRVETPKLGNKRKRSAADSPIGPLSFAASPLPVRDDIHIRAQSSNAPTASHQSASSHSRKRADHYHFMQQLVSYRTLENRELILEALSKFRFPSGQGAGDTFTSLMLNGLAKPPSDDKDSGLPLLLSRVISGLWRQCLEHEYYTPLRILLDVLSFSIHEQSASNTATLIEEILPLCTRTMHLVKNNDFGTSMRSLSLSKTHSEKQQRLLDEIDIEGILDILLYVCNAASLSKPSLERFWKNLDFYDTLLMIHKACTSSQILDGLEILRTSAMSTTFGPISEDVTTQNQQETSIIDRLLNLLFESRPATEDDPSDMEDEVMHLRITVLKLFQKLCESEHGGLLLAKHRSAVGRIIQYLNGQINRLYRLVPTKTHITTPKNDAHALVTSSINMSTRLLYHLLATYDHVINMSEKLRVIRGGYHVFLISMTRLAFSEQLVYERGIEDDVAEAAHLILDTVLSPEEGEAIREAVETPRGTRASRVSDIFAIGQVAAPRGPIGSDVQMPDADA